MSSELGKLIQQPARNEHFTVLVLKVREDLGCLTVYKILVEKKTIWLVIKNKLEHTSSTRMMSTFVLIEPSLARKSCDFKFCPIVIVLSS